MPLLNYSQASRATGKDRETLKRAVKTGKLSWSKDGNGREGIEVTELLRVYGPLLGSGEAPQKTPTAPQEPASEAPQGKATADLVAVLQEQLRQAGDRERRLWEQLEATLRLLPPPREVDIPPPQAPEKPTRGFSLWWLVMVPIVASALGYAFVRWGIP